MAPGKKPDQTGYIKGVYVSHAALGDAGFTQHIHELLESTELNAVVVDFKSDPGQLTFPSQVDMAHQIGADREVMIQDVPEFMRWFTDRGIYTIARIPVFKDDVLAQAHPEWAVINAGTGQVWRDPDGMGWMDPSRQEVWDYDIALAVEAARLGFDEVQLDYVRFPTDGNVGVATFSSDNTLENRTAAIAGLLQRARDALAPLRVKLGADIFGYAPWVADDLGIGQNIVLTFDDSTPGQFRLTSDDALDSETAIGVLMGFHKAHPADWPLKATFFVRSDPADAEVFSTTDLTAAKLKLLVDWGLEIGIQPAGAIELNKAAPEDVQAAIGQSLARLDAWLPGYEVFSLLVPDGRYPKDMALLRSGFYNGTSYAIGAAVSPGGGLVASPLTPQFDPYHITRVPVAELESWLEIAGQPSAYYVSAGEAPQGSP